MIDYANWLGHRGRVATRKAGKPGWLAFEVNCRGMGQDAIVTGGVPYGFTKEGKPKWRKPYDTVCVVEIELQAERAEYERTTGKCADCEGEAKRWIGWSRDEGNKFGPCARCQSTGKARP